MSDSDDNGLFFARASIANDAVERLLWSYVEQDLDRVRHLISLLAASQVVRYFYLDLLESEALQLEVEDRLMYQDDNSSRPAVRLSRMVQRRLAEFDE